MMQSSPFNFQRAVVWIGRVVIGVIFVYAGYAKLTYPNHNLWPWFMLKFSVLANLSTFAFQVESYRVLGAAGSSWVAHTLPLAEIVLGLLLLLGWKLRIWATIASAILLGFLAVVTRAYLLHMDINCGCFGTARQRAGAAGPNDDRVRPSASAEAACVGGTGGDAGNLRETFGVLPLPRSPCRVACFAEGGYRQADPMDPQYASMSARCALRRRAPRR